MKIGLRGDSPRCGVAFRGPYFVLVSVALTCGPVGAAVDMNNNGVSDVYEWYFGVTPDLLDTDADGDGHITRTEAAFGTDPLDGSSVTTVKVDPFTQPDPSVWWYTVSGVRYQLLRAGDFSQWSVEGPVVDGDGDVFSRAVIGNVAGTYFRIASVPPLDSDGDGLDDFEESLLGTDTDSNDTDRDGLLDADEFSVYLTDPAASNDFVNISGLLTYSGSDPGPTCVIASPSRFGWMTNNSTGIDGPGAYTIDHIPMRSSYWIKAFRDLNTNGVWEASEPSTTHAIKWSVPPEGLTNVTVDVQKVRAMRVDFAYYLGYGAEGAARLIVSNAVDWRVNTIYALAYSWQYGTYWIPDGSTPFLLPEPGIGDQDALPELIEVAHSNGIKVIAWLQPLNSCSNAWMQNPSWRATRADGSYYDAPEDRGSPQRYLLSPFNTGYLHWMDSVINEILDLGVDGLDVSETMVDPQFGTNLTYDAAATNLFFERYPNGALGDDDWVALRSEILTSNVYRRIGQLVDARTNKDYHVTATWAPDSGGELKPASVIADATGFDFDAILDLPEEYRPNVYNAEVVWQSKAARHCDTNTFNPGWTAYAIQTVVDKAAGRTLCVGHPEMSTAVPGELCGLPELTPTRTQFEMALFHAITNSAGADFYSHHTVTETNAGSVVSNVYWSVP
ncbi:MAG: hypothetical protein KJ626_04980 [Verrucomicrobia bacterium]|nr:hypothetical protein [Verrucomicrobiota bacterium]